VRAVPEPGEIRNLFFSYQGGCNDDTRIIPGRAIYVGTRGVIWEDTTNTVRSTSHPVLAGLYERLGRIFDEDQYESVRDNFGDPLRRDAVTDGDGRVHMVFSQRLNGSGAAAFVTSCDQFLPTCSADPTSGSSSMAAYRPTRGQGSTARPSPKGGSTSWPARSFTR
jgi:hypothetical protein